MSKLIILEFLTHDLNQELIINLVINDEQNQTLIKQQGKLPANLDIENLYVQWKKSYLQIENTFRPQVKTAQSFKTKNVHKECQEQAEKLKQCMKDWLKSSHPEWAKIREAIFQFIPDQNEELRIFIETKNPLIKKLWWHEWDLIDQYYLNTEIALIPPEYKAIYSNNQNRNKTRILAILGESTGLNTTTEEQVIKQLPDTESVFIHQPNPQELIQHIQDNLGWDIMFFAGHSSSDNNLEKGIINLNKDYGLSIDDLRKSLQIAINNGLRIAFFNSCDGLGLAQELAQLNIPQIIVMREPIPDIVARKFAETFMQNFLKGDSFYQAIAKSRHSLEYFKIDIPGVMNVPIICQNPAHKTAIKKQLLTNNWQCIYTLTGHSDMIKSVAISPDNKIIASGSLDQQIKLWDLNTGKILKTLTEHTGGVTCVKFSGDGKILVSSSVNPDGTIRLWNPQTGELKTVLKSDDWVVVSLWSVGISEHGETLVTAHHSDNTVRIWDGKTGKINHILRGHVWAVHSVDLSPNGQLLASGSWDSNIKIWNAKTGRLLETLQGSQSIIAPVQSFFSNQSVYTVAFSHNGKILASGGENQPIQLWNLSNNKCFMTLTGHSKAVYSVAFSPDDALLASGSEDCTIRIWNLSTGELMQTFGHSDVVYSLTFSSDGKTLVSGSKDKTIKIWQNKS